MPGIAGRRAMVRIPGAPAALSGEACANLGDNRAYRVTNAARRVLAPNAAITVRVGGTPTGESFTLNRLTGTVTFATANAGRGAVTLDGQFLPLSTALGLRSYNWSLNATLADDTDWDTATADNGFQRRIQTMLDVTGSIGGKWRVDGPAAIWRDALLNESLVVLEFFPDRAGARDLIAWAVLAKQSLQMAMESVHTMEVEWQGEADADGRAASL